MAVIYKIVKTHMFSPDVLLKNNIHKYSTSKVDTSNPRIGRPSVKCQEKQATERAFFMRFMHNFSEIMIDTFS